MGSEMCIRDRGSTVRSYLSYLCDEGLIAARFEDNRLLWERV